MGGSSRGVPRGVARRPHHRVPVLARDSPGRRPALRRERRGSRSGALARPRGRREHFGWDRSAAAPRNPSPRIPRDAPAAPARRAHDRAPAAGSRGLLRSLHRTGGRARSRPRSPSKPTIGCSRRFASRASCSCADFRSRRFIAQVFGNSRRRPPGAADAEPPLRARREPGLVVVVHRLRRSRRRSGPRGR